MNISEARSTAERVYEIQQDLALASDPRQPLLVERYKGFPVELQAGWHACSTYLHGDDFRGDTWNIELANIRSVINTQTPTDELLALVGFVRKALS